MKSEPEIAIGAELILRTPPTDQHHAAETNSRVSLANGPEKPSSSLRQRLMLCGHRSASGTYFLMLRAALSPSNTSCVVECLVDTCNVQFKGGNGKQSAECLPPNSAIHLANLR